MAVATAEHASRAVDAAARGDGDADVRARWCAHPLRCVCGGCGTRRGVRVAHHRRDRQADHGGTWRGGPGGRDSRLGGRGGPAHSGRNGRTRRRRGRSEHPRPDRRGAEGHRGRNHPIQLSAELGAAQDRPGTRRWVCGRAQAIEQGGARGWTARRDLREERSAGRLAQCRHRTRRRRGGRVDRRSPRRSHHLSQDRARSAGISRPAPLANCTCSNAVRTRRWSSWTTPTWSERLRTP